MTEGLYCTNNKTNLHFTHKPHNKALTVFNRHYFSSSRDKAAVRSYLCFIPNYIAMTEGLHLYKYNKTKPHLIDIIATLLGINSLNSHTKTEFRSFPAHLCVFRILFGITREIGQLELLACL